MAGSTPRRSRRLASSPAQTQETVADAPMSKSREGGRAVKREPTELEELKQIKREAKEQAIEETDSGKNVGRRRTRGSTGTREINEHDTEEKKYIKTEKVDSGKEEPESEDGSQGGPPQNGGANSSSAVPAYERARLDKIKRNMDMMQALGISNTLLAENRPTVKRSRPSGSSSRKKPRPQREPTRVSARLRKAQGQQTDDSAPMLELGATGSLYNGVPEERIYRLPSEPIDAEVETDLFDLSATSVPVPKSETLSSKDYSALSSKWKMNIDVIKLTRQRATALTFLPSVANTIVFAGDKTGGFGFVKIPEDRHVEDFEEEAYLFEPHVNNVSDIVCRFDDCLKVYSSSYDGTIRCFDLEKKKFFQVFAVDEDFSTRITCLDFVKNATNHMIAGRDDGYISLVDVRAKSSVGENELHERKINSVSLVADTEWYLATASLDRTVSLWDIRKLPQSRGAGSGRKGSEKSNLATFAHSRSVNSAMLSPDGKRLLTTCMDDTLRIFDTDKQSLSKKVVRPSHLIRHNNQTGRWLTRFRAVWDPKCSSVFSVGSMQRPRTIEIFSIEGGRAQPISLLRDEEKLQSVQSLVAFHPFQNKLVGVNSSGRISLFSA